MPVIVPIRGSIGVFFKGDKTLDRYWQFQGNFYDASGNGRHGTAGTGITFKRHTFLSGRGISAVGDGSSNAKMTWSETKQWGDFTQVCWFKCGIYNTDWRIFFQIGGGGANNNIASFGIVKSNDATNPGKIWFGAYFNTGYDLYSPQRYDDDRWHFVARVRQGSNHYGYVDGRLVVLGSISTTLTAPGQEAVFYNRYYNANFFKGELAEVAVFGRALSSQEILEYYRWATSSPKKYWYFLPPPAITLNTQLNLITNLKTTERINPITSFNFSNAQTSFKETIRQMTSFNFSGSATTTLGRIVQGVIRRIINPRGGGIIKNR